MKLVKKTLVFFLFIFISVNTNANNKVEALANKMVNNPQVIQLLKNKIALAVVNSFELDLNQNSLAISEKIDFVKKENIKLLLAVNEQFPDFENLNKSDKTKILKSLYNSPILTGYWTCIAQKVGSFSILVLGTEAAYYRYEIFKTCIYASLVADVAGAVVTDGVALVAEATAAVGEVTACKLLVGATGAVSTTAISDFVLQLLAC